MEGAIVIDPPAEGRWNMARDRLFAELAAAKKRAVLRIYRWSEPTLSLGRFQSVEERKQLYPGVSWVKRSTGGGAILHHHDWTYSIALPTDKQKGHEQALYESVHGGIATWLRRLGWEAEFFREQNREWPQVHSPFLCFERRSDLDIVVGESKVMGSAQRRISGAVLQHGSLLLEKSPHTPALLGLRDLDRNGPGSDTDESLDWIPFLTAIRASLGYFGISSWQRVTIDFPEHWMQAALTEFEGETFAHF